MSIPTSPSKTHDSRTRVLFDLRDELTPAELEKFETAAVESGAESLTEHFLNIALRHPKEGRSA